MSLLIFAFIVIVILALVVWLIQSAPMFDQNIRWILQALAVVAAILAILMKAGLVSG